jgi:hypothetical protein
LARKCRGRITWRLASQLGFHKTNTGMSPPTEKASRSSGTQAAVKCLAALASSSVASVGQRHVGQPRIRDRAGLDCSAQPAALTAESTVGRRQGVRQAELEGHEPTSNSNRRGPAPLRVEEAARLLGTRSRGNQLAVARARGGSPCECAQQQPGGCLADFSRIADRNNVVSFGPDGALLEPLAGRGVDVTQVVASTHQDLLCTLARINNQVAITMPKRVPRAARQRGLVFRIIVGPVECMFLHPKENPTLFERVKSFTASM